MNEIDSVFVPIIDCVSCVGGRCAFIVCKTYGFDSHSSVEQPLVLVSDLNIAACAAQCHAKVRVYHSNKTYSNKPVQLKLTTADFTASKNC